MQLIWGKCGEFSEESDEINTKEEEGKRVTHLLGKGSRHKLSSSLKAHHH
jgi:hypothetical protein